MITHNDTRFAQSELTQSELSSYGLPSEKELADWANSIDQFTENREQRTVSRGQGAINREQLADSRAYSFSPIVVPGTSLPSSNFSSFDVNRIRADFPILSERLSNGKQLIWLDNGATTQKPRQVINRISYFYEHENSNVHRGAHELATR